MTGQTRSLHPLVVIALVSALYLQRFGLSTSGGSFISLGQMVVLIAGVYLLVVRRVVIDLPVTLLFATFLGYAFFVTLWSLAQSSDITNVAPQSLVLVVTLYAVICLRPIDPDRTADVLKFFNRHMFIIGLLGIAQFTLQFVGIQVFTFRDFVPAPLLIEHAYNVTIPLTYGSPYLKGNGVFFLEPSLFSQFAALALAAEALFFRRVTFLAVFAVAIVVSYSGSGPLVLAATLVAMSVVRPRFVGYLIGFVVALAAFLAVASLVAPDVYAYYVRRAFEVRSSGSSSYLRYVTPFILLDDTARGAQLFFGYGPGTAEKFQAGYEYTVNALVKMIVDYGLVGATLFFGFVLGAFTRRSNVVLLVLCLYWYVLGGGYHFTSSVVHTIAALLVWSVPEVRRRESHSGPAAMVPL